jgi:hypothetical protein
LDIPAIWTPHYSSRSHDQFGLEWELCFSVGALQEFVFFVVTSVLIVYYF